MKKDFIKEILQEKEIILLIKQPKKQELKILIDFIIMDIRSWWDYARRFANTKEKFKRIRKRKEEY